MVEPTEAIETVTFIDSLKPSKISMGSPLGFASNIVNTVPFPFPLGAAWPKAVGISLPAEIAFSKGVEWLSGVLPC